MDAEFSFLFLYSVFLTARANFDPYSDSTRFVITFPGPLPKQEGDVISSTSDLIQDDDSLVLVTQGNEKYKCIIPEIISAKSAQKQAAEESNYVGANELELLAPLLQQSSCSYKIEPYWTYELCHSRFLRQYHEEREADKEIKLQEYYLGYYKAKDEDIHETEKKKEKRREVKTKQIGGLDLPYYEILYTDGTMCDLTGRPRQTSVLYICHELGRGEIYELKETSSCEYEVIVLTQLLCSHPLYTARKDPVNKISCHALDGSPRRPKSLVNFELENTQARYNRPEPAVWSLKQEKGEAFIRFTVDEDGVSSEDEIDLWEEIDWETEYGISLEAVKKFIIETIKEQEQLYPKTEVQRPPKSHVTEQYVPPDESIEQDSEPSDLPITKPSGSGLSTSDRQLLKDLLSGEYCIQGGTGWWKHEFCYGKRVTQFHEDNSGKTVIVLGVWDEDVHIAWIEKHPSKRPKHISKDNQIVYHYYGNGDICDVTGLRRYVEVRLKCKDNPSNAHSMSVYLLETRTCEYILVVESPVLCMVLEKADSDGIIDDPLI